VGPQLALYVNQKAFEGLPSEYKAIIEAASAYAHTDMQAKYDYRNHDALKTLLSQGAKLHAFPKDVMTAAFKSSQQIYSDLSNSNPNWKKIYADYSKYRRESNLWFSFAENNMDSFMQKLKL
jgi:TRAP-type mannitol/chloroaromatic compound transport system substrate-binding protein